MNDRFDEICNNALDGWGFLSEEAKFIYFKNI